MHLSTQDSECNVWHLRRWIFVFGGRPSWPVMLCAAISQGLFVIPAMADSVARHVILSDGCAWETLQDTEGFEIFSSAYLGQQWQLKETCRGGILGGKPRAAMWWTAGWLV